jgi:hypothetical protein
MERGILDWVHTKPVGIEISKICFFEANSRRYAGGSGDICVKSMDIASTIFYKDTVFFIAR